MATYTTRNDLIKPEYTDAADVEDFNDNMDFIDGSIAPCTWDATTAPTANDDVTLGYIIGSLWFDVTNHKLYICEDNTDTAAVWRQFFQSGAAISTPYQITSTLADGTAPFVLTSKTKTSNLNADMLDGLHDTSFLKADGSVTATGQIASTYNGGAPFTVVNTSEVTNLNADYLDGLHKASFAILAGQAGGQTLYGGTAKDESLNLYSNSNGATGYVNVPQANLVLGTKATTAPNFAMAIHEGAAGAANPIYFIDGDGSTVRARIDKSSGDSLQFYAGDGTTVDVAISGTSGVLVANNGLYSVRTLTDPDSYTTGITNANSITYTGTASLAYYGLNSSAYPIVAATKTNSAGVTGLVNNVLRNNIAAGSDDDGTLSELTGQLLQVGHLNTNTSMKGTTTTVYGMRIIPYIQYGTISTLYTLMLNSVQGTGTLTTPWGIYCQSAASTNYYATNYNRFQTTSGNNVIYVVASSTTDPIADDWTKHCTTSLKDSLDVLDTKAKRKALKDDFKKVPVHKWKHAQELSKEHYEAMFPDEVPLPGEPEKSKSEKDKARQDKKAKHLDKISKLKKFTREQYGVFAEDAPEAIQAFDEENNVIGLGIGAYVGWLHSICLAQEDEIDDLKTQMADVLARLDKLEKKA